MKPSIQFWIALWTALCCLTTTLQTQAQVVPDTTLPNNSNVTPQDGNTSIITGGTVAGSNLFHSFKEFSVPTGGTAYFNNASEIHNIISRVTGSSISNIDGLLKANGSANLFLLNPNGIIFGPNARLDIGGSFVGSTASSLKFADGNQFSATAPQTTPLLTVSVPLGLQFGPTAGSIVNQSKATNISGEPVGLQVRQGKTLALVGGNVRLEGATMLAPGGRVELGGVSGSGTVEFVDSNNLRLSFPDSIARADVALTDGTFVGVAAGGGGDIAINARNIDILGGSYLFAGIDYGLGSGTAVAGDVTLNATGKIALKQSSNIVNEVSRNATGNSGNIDIQAQSLDLENAFVSASTFGQGNAGRININARDTVSFVRSMALSEVEGGAVGNSNGININTGSLSLTDGSFLATSTFGVGNAGTINLNARDTISLDQSSKVLSEVIINQAYGNSGGININTGSLSLTNGSFLATSTFGQGNGGTININARDRVSFTNSWALSQVERNAVGNSGSINITTGSLELTNGSFLATSTFGVGNGGTININARDRVSFANSWAFSQVESNAYGNSGGINITAESLFLTNSLLLAHTKGKGNAGTINLNARDTISLDQSSRVLSEVIENQAYGNSGGININTGSLFVTNGSFLATSTFGVGNGGTININARDRVSFTIGGAFSQVEPNAVGNSGGINITTGSLFLTISDLLAQTKGKGNAGTINLNARDIISLDYSRVLSEVIVNQAYGNSGGINITTGSLFLTNEALLATSTFEVGNGGTININARDRVSFFNGSKAFSQVENTGIGDSGGIDITTGSLFLTNSKLLAHTKGKGNAGTINLNARDTISLAQHSEVLSEVRENQAYGNSGSININTGSLSLTDGSFLATSTFGAGNAGSININARDRVSLTGRGIYSQVEPDAVGNSGSIDITTGSLFLTNSELLAHTKGKGNAGTINLNARDTISLAQSSVLSEVRVNQAYGNSGSININTGSLSLTDGSFLATSTFGAGNAGTININARDRVSITGRGVYSQVERNALGDSGSINITTGSLFLTNSELLAHTKGKGNAGTINLNARDIISLDQTSRVLSEVIENQAYGNSGSININTGSLELTNGSFLATSTFGVGNAGTININARDKVSVTGRGIYSQGNAVGDSGGINITTRSLFVTNDAQVSVSSEGIGNAGNLDIKANVIRLENQGKLRASTAAGTGGNITLSDLKLLLMRDRSLISAEALNDANGGNITINAKDGFIVAVPRENSNILAKAAQGRGGQIEIRATGIYGFENYDRNRGDRYFSNISDINASSEAGSQLDGTVEISTPDIDPNSGLINLPSVPVDTEVAQSCTAGGNVAKSQFTVTGRGGLPPNPGEPLNTDAVQVDLITLNPSSDRPNSPTVTNKTTTPVPERIVEATGWIINKKGEVVLIANAPTTTPHSPSFNQPDCRAS